MVIGRRKFTWITAPSGFEQTWFPNYVLQASKVNFGLKKGNLPKMEQESGTPTLNPMGYRMESDRVLYVYSKDSVLVHFIPVY